MYVLKFLKLHGRLKKKDVVSTVRFNICENAPSFNLITELNACIFFCSVYFFSYSFEFCFLCLFPYLDIIFNYFFIYAEFSCQKVDSLGMLEY